MKPDTGLYFQELADGGFVQAGLYIRVVFGICCWRGHKDTTSWRKATNSRLV